MGTLANEKDLHAFTVAVVYAVSQKSAAYLEQVAQNFKAVQQRDELLKQETARADQFAELVHQRNEKIKDKDKKMQEETERAEKYVDASMRKDYIIKKKENEMKVKEEALKAEKARANAATKNFETAQRLINGLAECRHCHSGFDQCLQWDSNRSVYMIRCRNCSTKHYTEHL